MFSFAKHDITTPLRVVKLVTTQLMIHEPIAMRPVKCRTLRQTFESFEFLIFS